MKHVCILISNDGYAIVDADTRALLDVFRANGFAFQEVRMLVDVDDIALRQTLQDCTVHYDEIFCVAHANCLDGVREICKEVFSQSQHQALGANSIFLQGTKSVFLAKLESAYELASQTSIPYLQSKYSVRYARSIFRVIGANKAHLQAIIAQAKRFDEGKAQYFYTRRHADTVLEILFDERISKRAADEVTRLFAEGLKECVYAMDDSTIEQQLITLLKLRGKKISVAESFTGGAIAKRITSVSGASEVYFEGLNTYNEYSKVKRLGVSEYTLHSFGAVSDNTAYEMAAGLIAGGDCDLAIATTGLAGPHSDRSMLPVGLCYIAVGTKEQVLVYRYKFDGTREQIREMATEYALFLAYRQLKNM